MLVKKVYAILGRSMTIGLKHSYSKGVYSGLSMLLTHQTFVTSTKSKKYFSRWSGTDFFKEVKLFLSLNILFLGS